MTLGESAWNENGENPNIVALWDEIGYNGVQYADETAWCAVFVGACLKRSQNKYLQTASSQAYATYGEEVLLVEDSKPGDILVFYRKGEASGFGHVGFFTGNGVIDEVSGIDSLTLNVSEFLKRND